MYLKIFASCILSKGKMRSIIIDLQRNSYTPIPNDMYNILTDFSSLTVEEVKGKYDIDDCEIIDSYIDFLVENEFAFFTNIPEQFPETSNEFSYPYLISNALIDYKGAYDIKEVVNQLNSLRCKNIEIRIFYNIEWKDLKELFNLLDYFKINDLKVYLPFSNFYETDEFIFFLKNLQVPLSFITFFDYGNVSKLLNIGNVGVYYTNERSFDERSCGIIDKSYFTTNTLTITESQHHNTCLNRKISIDKDGYIKNCPSMPQHFGNIKDTTLEEALSHRDFKKYWNVTKDQIEVCKDCEFRHICTDCRAYTERTHFEGDIDLSKPLKCGYNPYTNEWAEWSTNPLKQKAIEYYGMQELVKLSDVR